MTNMDLMYQKWRTDFSKLEDEIKRFRSYFNQNKKCQCSIEECKHFKKARHRIFGKRIDDLFNLSMKTSLLTFSEINDLTN